MVVAFYDKVARVFRAEDYYLSDLAQCDGKRGACPDERIGGRNDVTVGAYRKNFIPNESAFKINHAKRETEINVVVVVFCWYFQ